ncbi:Gfo/Idh/MocA family protein [Microvirga sp. G4-2]|uniref:Gfo/Idh/MocA family protein n=1 Tax=Microvirga sp. G4-2 TaxID=3434467 RepID=UPI0040441F99
MTKERGTRLRAGLVGCGGFAQAALIPATRMAPIDLVAVCDRDQERAEACGHLLRTPAIYTSLDDLLAREQLDVVIMAIGPNVYPELAEKVMRAGVDVYVEKPPAVTVDKALRMREVSRETGRNLAVGFMKRFATGYRMAKELTSAPDFGRLMHLTARICSGVWTPAWSSELTTFAFVLDHSVHYLDLIQFYAGPVASVTAELSQASNERFGYAVLLRFQSGATGLLEISNYESRGVPNERIQLMGSEGNSVMVENVSRVTYSRNAPPMSLGRHFDPAADRVVWEPNMTNISPENSSLVHQGYVGEMRHLADMLLSNRPTKPDIDDGIAAVQLAHAIVASNGQRIELPR